MENRKRPSSYKKSSGNKAGDRSFKRDDKPFKKEGDSRPARYSKDASARPGRSFDKKDGDDTKRPYKKFDSDRPGRPSRDNNDRPGRPSKDFSDRPKRTFDKSGDRFKKDGDKDRKPFEKREGSFKSYRDNDKSGPKKFDSDKRHPFGHSDRFKKDGDGESKPFEKKEGGYKKDYNDKDKRPFKKFDGDKPRSFDKPDRFKKEGDSERKPYERKEGGYKKEGGERPPYKKFDSDRPSKRPYDKAGGARFKKPIPEPTKRGTKDLKTGEPLKFHKFTKFGKEEKEASAPKAEMTLNKYISHSGECSRREAAEMVKQGKVKVNGELVLDPGTRIGPDDNVTFAGKKITPTKHFIYVLLNKPKGYITTTDDPEGRQTVMDLVDGVEERVYPVGRLDRNTSGLLLFTNDGDLAQRLSHPSFETKKVYQVSLDRPLEKEDFEKIRKGVELEDGKAKVDDISYLAAKNEIGLEIHSGKNRIVRRIFESLKYDVEKLDRVMYAGLTKKNIPRGKWRLLTEREVVLLKHFKS